MILLGNHVDLGSRLNSPLITAKTMDPSSMRRRGPAESFVEVDMPYLDMGLQPSTPFTTVSLRLASHDPDPSSPDAEDTSRGSGSRQRTAPLRLQHAALRHHRSFAIVQQAVAPLEGHGPGLAAAARRHLLALPVDSVERSSLSEPERVAVSYSLKRRKRRQRALNGLIPSYVCDILQQSGRVVLLL